MKICKEIMKTELPIDQFYRSLPKKRVAAAAVFRNSVGDILILHKNYGNGGWNLPGGVVEWDESPVTGLIREIREEIGLKKNNFIFLGVDYRPAPNDIVSESLQFPFDGGVLSDKEVEEIKLSEEHQEFRFLPLEQVLPLLSPSLSKRLQAVWVSNGSVYLESGEII